jgi:hypothetical protein
MSSQPLLPGSRLKPRFTYAQRKHADISLRPQFKLSPRQIQILSRENQLLQLVLSTLNMNLEAIRTSLNRSTQYTSMIRSKPPISKISKAERCERENHLLWTRLQFAVAQIGIAKFTVDKLSGEEIRKEARKSTRHWRRHNHSIARQLRKIERETADIVASGAAEPTLTALPD